ncbi:MAG TPA: glycosyltransferase family 4 protein [Bryobacteraceae bacterium]|jgi:glycosyltransferase involved in cell wall biosynthesis
MRILLAHNSLYYPSFGGGDKSNRLLMEALAKHGHQVRVMARVEKFGDEAHRHLLADLSARLVEAHDLPPAALQFHLNGVDTRVLTRAAHLKAFFEAQIREFDPDVIVTSTDDPGQLLLQSALHAPRARVVYLIRAIVGLPFGPDTPFANESKTAAIRRADGIVAVSENVAEYARAYGKMPALHVPISLLDATEPPAVARFDNRYVTMVNPCAVKGITVFTGLAEHFPRTEFACVPTWGTTAEDIAALRRHANITILPPVDDIHDILRQTRIALVPSLWAEARSRVILEAMIRGIPVLASDVGGLKEAKLGVDYLLPVTPVVRYHARVDHLMVPMADIPEQNLDPWRNALQRLLTDRAHYDHLSTESRRAALDYARHLTAQPFEDYLEQVIHSPKRRSSHHPPAAAKPSLSAERRKLLTLRLKQKPRGHSKNVD